MPARRYCSSVASDAAIRAGGRISVRIRLVPSIQAASSSARSSASGPPRREARRSVNTFVKSARSRASASPRPEDRSTDSTGCGKSPSFGVPDSSAQNQSGIVSTGSSSRGSKIFPAPTTSLNSASFEPK